MAIVATMAAILEGIMDVIGHFIAGIGDKVPSFLVFALAEQVEGNAGGHGGS